MDTEKDTPKEKSPFNCFLKIFYNTETKEYAFETNVPDVITGYGLCDFAKKSIDAHITRLQKNQIVPANGGIMNFVKGIKR